MTASSRAFRRVMSYRSLYSVITVAPLLAVAALTIRAESAIAPISAATDYHVSPDGGGWAHWVVPLR